MNSLAAFIRRTFLVPVILFPMAGVFALSFVSAGAQANTTAKPAATKAAPQKPSSANATPEPVPLPDMSGRDALILKHLNAVLTWYHSIDSQAPSPALPTDWIYQSNARALGEQAVQSAFQSAGADAVLVARAGAGSAQGGSPEAGEDVNKLAPQLQAQITQVKAQLAALDAQISSANSQKAEPLVEERVRLQGELELLTAEDSAIEQLAKYSANTGTSGGTNLQKSIAQLQRNVPEAAAAPANATAGKTTATAAAARVPQEASGLISETEELISQASSLHKLAQLNKEALDAEALARQLRAPLIDQIHKTLALAASWASQTPQANGQPAPNAVAAPPLTAANADGSGPTKQQFDALTTEFKQLSAAALPLSQEIIALDQSSTNLTQWRQSLGEENNRLLVRVFTRVGLIAISLGLLSFLSFLSNRLIVRYVTDIRRRRQILILRRFIVGFLMGIVLILGFVSEFSSLATFAGFITAGIAVGLQTILLSVAAYFFLVGRYGIRVGDRISISGTTGDVIDVGLIRLYMMELAGTGNDIFPTGRIVVFPNSVLFQATVPLYKQIPGTDYAWHEIVATLTAAADAKMVQDRMLEAVKSVHETYRADFERQHAASSRVLDIRIEVPAPSAHLQFATTGLESVVRYPVALGNVARADEQVTEKVLAALSASVDLKAAITGMPVIRVAVKG